MNSSNRAARLSASRRRGSLGQDIISDIKSGIIPRLEQVINDASSEGDRWTLQVVPEDSDPLKGFHTLTWTHPSGRKNIWYENCDNRIFNVYAIEPWSHTAEDLQRFQAKRGFHPSRIPSMKLLEDFPWGWEEELWAELYSRCWATNARWFVVTTYENWIFGVFSETWESAAITAIHPYTSKQPNIIECLFFWLFSAMHQDRWDWAYKIPEVSTDSTATLTTSDLRTENNLPPDVRKIFGPTEQEQEQVFRLTRLCNIAKPTQDPPSGRPTRVLTVDLWRKPMDLKNLLAPHPYAEFIATLHEKEARIRRWRLGQLGFTDDAKIRNEVRDEDEDSMVIDG
ncbi:hypothetical protein FRC02_000929 [Tulasnella sp. 418]|nr:hypothetical protein FRC02_000929 [Tulasnella sp. 418]